MGRYELTCTLQEAEKFTDEYFGAEKIEKKAGPTFAFFSIKQTLEKEQSFYFAKISFYQRENGIEVETKVDTDGLLKLARKTRDTDTATELYEDLKQRYEGVLDKFKQDILKQLEKADGGVKSDLQGKWSRMKPETQRLYTEAWHIYLAVSKQYKADALDGWVKNSRRIMPDWQTRVYRKVKRKSGLPWIVDKRTLESVKQMGEEDIIPKKSRKK
jgi:hypothetical protein